MRETTATTEVVRHAVGLYQYAKTIDEQGQSLHAEYDGTLEPLNFPPELSPVDVDTDCHRLGVKVNEETGRILAMAEADSGLPVGDILDQSLEYMAQVVDANMNHAKIIKLPKIQ